ncbi:glycosyltransferase family 2 protein [Ligilactobacillus salivarius]|uniref:glycosyltransferase family 2 protein n=1 Tax=Ligilactobacillus salivarius TaxID=1624 RepID=UPI00237D350E|nr:glycosyltransferase family A protein [Ligilactobacillus salivarius]MDE1507153.1 glycosyltransferase family A protein [Ligilactobacillus salivarius]MDE1521673.1 glycosyltransferase family A protein [Ligilactobacillus salivarius]
MVKVSIILPVYNAADTVEKTIISVLNQTLKDIELIIIDDGSNIETKNVIRSFRDRRIKLIEQENSGVSNARNSGIRSAKGNYLFFIDSDDWIEKNYSKTCLYFLKNIVWI